VTCAGKIIGRGVLWESKTHAAAPPVRTSRRFLPDEGCVHCRYFPVRKNAAVLHKKVHGNRFLRVPSPRVLVCVPLVPPGGTARHQRKRARAPALAVWISSLNPWPHAVVPVFRFRKARGRFCSTRLRTSEVAVHLAERHRPMAAAFRHRLDTRSRCDHQLRAGAITSSWIG